MVEKHVGESRNGFVSEEAGRRPRKCIAQEMAYGRGGRRGVWSCGDEQGVLRADFGWELLEECAFPDAA